MDLASSSALVIWPENTVPYYVSPRLGMGMDTRFSPSTKCPQVSLDPPKYPPISSSTHHCPQRSPQVPQLSSTSQLSFKCSPQMSSKCSPQMLLKCHIAHSRQSVLIFFVLFAAKTKVAKRFLAGIRQWQKMTCVKFVPRANHRDWVEVFRERNPKSRRYVKRPS